MRSALRNRLAALERRARNGRPSHPPFVVAVEDPTAEGGARAVSVYTLVRGIARDFHGQQAETVWNRIRGR